MRKDFEKKILYHNPVVSVFEEHEGLQEATGCELISIFDVKEAYDAAALGQRRGILRWFQAVGLRRKACRLETKYRAQIEACKGYAMHR